MKYLILFTYIICYIFSFSQNDTINIQVFNDNGLIKEININTNNIKDTIPILIQGSGTFYLRCNKTSNLYKNNIFILNIFSKEPEDSIYLITQNDISNE